jgi:hypothetical protein
MSFYMNSPLCRQLNTGEKRLPGDIGAIRKNKNPPEEVHGFIYISERLAYSKNGPEETSPYALQSLDNVFKIYEVSEENECRENTFSEKSRCSIALSMFRCKSLDEYLKETKDVPETLLESMNSISKFEHCQQTELIKGTALPEQALQGLKDVAAALVTYLEEKRKNQTAQMKEQEKFVIGALQLRLESLVNQFANKGDDDSAHEISILANQIKDSAQKLSQ